jgi:hypothetical protein
MRQRGHEATGYRSGRRTPGNLPAGYVPKQLQSTWWPGFGAVLRAHAADPNETFFALVRRFIFLPPE